MSLFLFLSIKWIVALWALALKLCCFYIKTLAELAVVGLVSIYLYASFFSGGPGHLLSGPEMIDALRRFTNWTDAVKGCVQ